MINKYSSNFLFYFSIIIIVIVFFFPFFWIISSSFKSPEEIISKIPTYFPNTFTLEHYNKLIITSDFVKKILCLGPLNL